MKQLIIVRHAKSDWSDSKDDFNRTLMQRGKTDAKLVATESKPFLPSQYTIWSSTAKRAVETATIFASEYHYPKAEIIFKDDLYTFGLQSFESTIRACDNGIDALMVFGHNEAITLFVNKYGDLFIDNVPTSGFISITFDTNQWSFIQNGSTSKFIYPRDLK